MNKKLLSTILTIIMVASLLPAGMMGASAAVVESGTCGENSTYTLETSDSSSGYILRISGYGEISSPPLIFERTNIETIYILPNPGTHITISQGCFQRYTGLSRIYLTNCSILGRAFLDCTSLKDVYSENVYTNFDPEDDFEPFRGCDKFGLTFHCNQSDSLYTYAQTYYHFVDSGSAMDIFINMVIFFPRLFRSIANSLF